MNGPTVQSTPPKYDVPPSKTVNQESIILTITYGLFFCFRGSVYLSKFSVAAEDILEVKSVIYY